MDLNGGLFSTLLFMLLGTRTPRTYDDAPDWWRIYHEIILEGKETSEDDTPEQASRRQSLLEAVEAVRATGGVPQPLKE